MRKGKEKEEKREKRELKRSQNGNISCPHIHISGGFVVRSLHQSASLCSEDLHGALLHSYHESGPMRDTKEANINKNLFLPFKSSKKKSGQ